MYTYTVESLPPYQVDDAAGPAGDGRDELVAPAGHLAAEGRSLQEQLAGDAVVAVAAGGAREKSRSGNSPEGGPRRSLRIGDARVHLPGLGVVRRLVVLCAVGRRLALAQAGLGGADDRPAGAHPDGGGLGAIPVPVEGGFSSTQSFLLLRAELLVVTEKRRVKFTFRSTQGNYVFVLNSRPNTSNALFGLFFPCKRYRGKIFCYCSRMRIYHKLPLVVDTRFYIYTHIYYRYHTGF